jgi:hypothetical protein
LLDVGVKDLLLSFDVFAASNQSAAILNENLRGRTMFGNKIDPDAIIEGAALCNS